MKLGSCDDLIFEGLQYANNKLKRKEAIKMYAVIYWLGDKAICPYPHLNENNTLKIFDKIEEADNCADSLEDSQNKIKSMDIRILKLNARVISIETAKE